MTFDAASQPAQPHPIEAARAVAEHRIRRLEAAAADGASQLIKTSGWLTASLLTINGAGALASLNATQYIRSSFQASSLALEYFLPC